MAAMAPTVFKPDDIVRTPSGQTAVVVRINPDGSREIEDLKTLDRFDIMPRHLTLIRASTPRPWPKRVL
jgi:hypothetical protein